MKIIFKSLCFIIKMLDPNQITIVVGLWWINPTSQTKTHLKVQMDQVTCTGEHFTCIGSIYFSEWLPLYGTKYFYPDWHRLGVMMSIMFPILGAQVSLTLHMKKTLQIMLSFTDTRTQVNSAICIRLRCSSVFSSQYVKCQRIRVPKCVASFMDVFLTLSKVGNFAFNFSSIYPCV